MRTVPTSRLKEIFGPIVPMYALEFIEAATEDSITDEQLFAALSLMHSSKQDPRVGRALTIAKKVYSTPTATFEELYPDEAGAKIVQLLAMVFVEVFKDLDASLTKRKAAPIEERPYDHVPI